MLTPFFLPRSPMLHGARDLFFALCLALACSPGLGLSHLCITPGGGYTGKYLNVWSVITGKPCKCKKILGCLGDVDVGSSSESGNRSATHTHSSIDGAGNSMGCGNQKLHAQQIAYQRDFLGACWNSALGEDEAKEYRASRWMGMSKQVMELDTNNRCFTACTRRKKEKRAAADLPKAAMTAPDDPTGSQPGVGGSIGMGSGGRPRRASISVGTSAHAGSPLASPCSSMPVLRSSLTSGPRSGNFPRTVRQGQFGSSSLPYPASDDAEFSAANARIATAGKTKSSDSGTLRTVMKDAIELDKVAHSCHPYLQRHELSVYSGVVFRCAPAHRLYNRISLVPDARAKRLSNACVSASVGIRQDRQCTSTPPTPLDPPSSVAAPYTNRAEPMRSRSSLDTRGKTVKPSPLCEGDCGQADHTPALELGSTPARQASASGTDWETDDPLSAFNNYTIEDRDVDGVAATRPPVIIGSITAMELQALPQNAELCFGGWLYVSLQDEQERLRRSLARYKKRRKRHAATRKAAVASSTVSSACPAPSAFCKDLPSPGQSPGGRPYNSGSVEGVSNDGEALRQLWLRLDSSDGMSTCSRSPTAADAPRQLSVKEGLGDAVIADTEGVAATAAQLVDTTPAAEAASSAAHGDEEERGVPSLKTATAPPSPQVQASLAMARPLHLSRSTRNAVASSGCSLPRTAEESHKCVLNVAPQQQTPMRSVSPISPLRCTGKYAREVMEADTLVATWLPYAYVIIAVPMYECSLVPTVFHASLSRRKAVSLNLANAQSRQAYGVGCITAARYGGVMVVEYREKISEDDDAEWIDELLRVGRASRERYGEAGAKVDGTSATGFSASAAAGASTLSLRHLSRTMAHDARAEKLHRIKSHIWHKLRRQGLYVILASTRMADRRHRQQCAFVPSERSRVFPMPASSSGVTATSVPPHSKGTNSRHSAPLLSRVNAMTGDDGVDDIGCNDFATDMNGVVDYDSLDDNSGSDRSSRSDRTGRTSLSSGGSIRESAAARSGGGKRRHSLWSKLSLPDGSSNRRHRRHHHQHNSHGGDDKNAKRKTHHAAHFDFSGHQRDSGGYLGRTATAPCLWAETTYDNDFLLRGTYRQIGGMKYLDVVSLIDGCPVSELVHGIKRWVVNLLSMPIKARPLCLYLQRYEGIASSLQLLTTPLASTALATDVASGHLVAPMKLSSHASGGTGLEAECFVSQQQAEAIGGGVSTGSFSATSAPMNITAAASTVPRGVLYNTYYRGPLDPVVRAVMSPDVESMIAASKIRHLPEALHSTRLASPHTVTSDGATNVGPLPPTLPLLPSISDARRVMPVKPRVEIEAEVLCNSMRSTPSSPSGAYTGHPLRPHPSPNPSTSAAPPVWKERHRSPTASTVLQSYTTHVDPTSAPLLPSASLSTTLSRRTVSTVPPKHSSAGPSLEVTERPMCDDSLRSDSMAGSSPTATDGRRALEVAATASAMPGDSTNSPTGGGATNGSVPSPALMDILAVPPFPRNNLNQQGTPSTRSNCFSAAAPNEGVTDVHTRPDNIAEVGKPPRVWSLDGNTPLGYYSMRGLAHYSGQRSLREQSEAMAAAATECDNSSDAAMDRRDGRTASPAAEEEASYGEREWQLADCELRALKSELDEMHYLVSTAHSELLERLSERTQLGAIFLPHTRPDQVDLSLLALKMLRQYPEEVPVKEIHTDWVPMLMSLLTISRDNLFCFPGAGDNGGDTRRFLGAYNDGITQSDMYEAGTTRYTLDPLPPLPTPRPLHDIVIASQPIRFTTEMPNDVKQVGTDARDLAFAFSGGSFGVLAGVLYYYADFLRAKYHSGVAAAGGRSKEAGTMVQDVLARDGYNVVLRRIWIWGVIPELSEYKCCITSAVAKTKQLLRGKRPRREGAEPASSTESTSARGAEDTHSSVTKTAGLNSGGTQVRGQPFRSAEAYALYDAVLHYLRTLEELHVEHHGDSSFAPQGAMKRRSTLMAWRRNKGGSGAAVTAHGSSVEVNGAAGGAADSMEVGELVPRFEICVATNYYYKVMMEEARRPRTHTHRSSSPLSTSGDLYTHSETSLHKGTIRAAGDGPKAHAAILRPPSGGHAGKRAKKAVGRAQQHLEQPYCGGEEMVGKEALQRHAVKRVFKFLTDNYTQWCAQHSDDPAMNALAKRVHISIK
ncbi:hypothetical protein, unknown function [Leishmania tarentolae]|uniref:Uncharacterized protein n=1 Tax=Leishmania tarentolae TaxID=5689 RepID=A0A640KI99_LEITA|nr:hypothetical protein, unknown function [Leishmania tarentolae]